MRRIEFITSRAASKETMPCRASSADGAWKSAALQRGEIPIQGPRTAKIACYPFDWIHCCSSAHLLPSALLDGHDPGVLERSGAQLEQEIGCILPVDTRTLIE